MSDPRQLVELARLRADRSGQALARALGAIEELQARAEALRAPLPMVSSIAEARHRDRHAIWRQAQLRHLNLEIAGRRANAEPLRLAHARDRARVEVAARVFGDGPKR